MAAVLLPLLLLLAVPAAPAQATPAQATPVKATPAQAAEVLVPERVTPIVRVVHDVGPAVVNVYQEVVKEVELQYPLNVLYGPQRSRYSSLGSGFIIDSDGYILTNAHVIQTDTSEGIKVSLSDGTTFPAELVATDPDNDVALLHVTPDPDHPLQAAPIGTSSDIMVGETVIAIGNPLGKENSVSTGIVSSLFRDVRVPSAVPHGRPHLSPAFKDFIQIDAPINPGNSGGPLMNALGEVIGINFAIASDAQGIGFAIPIDRVRKSLMGNLINPRLKPEVVTGFEIAGDHTGKHVTVTQVAPEGPAARAGLEAGDQLLEVLAHPIRWEFDYSKALLATHPGDRVPVTVRRGDRTIRAEIELGKDQSPLAYVWRSMGLSVVDHPKFKGVRVERVDPTGPGAQIGIQAGDLIDGIGDEPLDSTLDLFAAVRNAPAGSRVVVHVWRGNIASAGQLRLAPAGGS
ncbi:MAG TPA: trypsin-like peptidase domain-containing protein [Planctomycetota bacterium]|nr:trypsin-like peptidase domain-containing protein [Planctomycetota bacterium]